MVKNLILDAIWPKFAPFPLSKFLEILPLRAAKHCPKLSSYVFLRKSNGPNLRKKQNS